MEDKLLKKYRFFGRVMIIFTIMVVSVMIPGSFMDVAAGEYSSFFTLAPVGISFSSLWQMLATSFAINVLQAFIFDSKVFEKVMTLYKSIFMIAGVMAIVICFVLVFGWFPMDMPSAWICFLGMFLICFILSTVVMVTKTKRESQMYDQLLTKYKEKRGEQKDE